MFFSVSFDNQTSVQRRRHRPAGGGVCVPGSIAVWEQNGMISEGPFRVYYYCCKILYYVSGRGMTTRTRQRTTQKSIGHSIRNCVQLVLRKKHGLEYCVTVTVVVCVMHVSGNYMYIMRNNNNKMWKPLLNTAPHISSTMAMARQLRATSSTRRSLPCR